MKSFGNIIKAGLILLFYEFLIILIYLLLVQPVPTTIEAIQDTGIVDELEEYGDLALTIWDYMFAIALIGPPFGFLVWVFKDEPDTGYVGYAP